jgi:hypothetical protein
VMTTSLSLPAFLSLYLSVCDLVSATKLVVGFSLISVQEFLTKIRRVSRGSCNRLSDSNASLRGVNEVLMLLPILLENFGYNLIQKFFTLNNFEFREIGVVRTILDLRA